jgi:hypothetical protein
METITIHSLGCKILSFKDKDKANNRIYEIDCGLPFLYMLTTMDINTIAIARQNVEMSISVGDSVSSYGLSCTHKISKFCIGLDGEMRYYNEGEEPGHEFGVKNIDKVNYPTISK